MFAKIYWLNGNNPKSFRNFPLFPKIEMLMMANLGLPQFSTIIWLARQQRETDRWSQYLLVSIHSFIFSSLPLCFPLLRPSPGVTGRLPGENQPQLGQGHWRKDLRSVHFFFCRPPLYFWCVCLAFHQRRVEKELGPIRVKGLGKKAVLNGLLRMDRV